MNVLPGKIVDVQVKGNLSLVIIEVGQLKLTSIVIETPDTANYLRPDQVVKVMFKETEVVIGYEQKSQVSLRNRIPVRIIAIRRGKLLSELKLAFKGHTIYSIITSQSVDQMELSAGTKVLAMIKTNEVMLSE